MESLYLPVRKLLSYAWLEPTSPLDSITAVLACIAIIWGIVRLSGGRTSRRQIVVRGGCRGAKSAVRWVRRKVLRQVVPPVWPPKAIFEASTAALRAVDSRTLAVALINEDPDTLEFILTHIPSERREELLRQSIVFDRASNLAEELFRTQNQ